MSPEYVDHGKARPCSLHDETHVVQIIDDADEGRYEREIRAHRDDHLVHSVRARSSVWKQRRSAYRQQVLQHTEPAVHVALLTHHVVSLHDRKCETSERR